MPDPGDQPAMSGRKIADVLSAAGLLRLVLRAFPAAPLGAGTPQPLISQAVAATGSSGGVVCGVRGDRVVILASEGDTPGQRPARAAHHGGSVLAPALCGDDRTASLAGVAGRCGRSVPAHRRTRAGSERAYAALPLRANGQSLGVSGISFAERHEFTEADRDFLLALADNCASTCSSGTSSALRAGGRHRRSSSATWCRLCPGQEPRMRWRG